MILTIKSGCLNRPYLHCDSEIVVPNDSKEIVVPDGITRIERNTFEGCDKVESFTLPKTLKSIGGRAFENCRSIKELTIPDGVIEIEYCAFAGCTDLTTIRLPGSVKKIDPTAFMSCFNLRNIVLAEDNQSFVYEDGLLMDKQKTMVVFAAENPSLCPMVLRQSVISLLAVVRLSVISSCLTASNMLDHLPSITAATCTQSLSRASKGVPLHFRRAKGCARFG